MAATGRQLKQSVNVFHSLMLYLRLPAYEKKKNQTGVYFTGGGGGLSKQCNNCCTLGPAASQVSHFVAGRKFGTNEENRSVTRVNKKKTQADINDTRPTAAATIYRTEGFDIGKRK